MRGKSGSRSNPYFFNGFMNSTKLIKNSGYLKWDNIVHNNIIYKPPKDNTITRTGYYFISLSIGVCSNSQGRISFPSFPKSPFNKYTKVEKQVFHYDSRGNRGLSALNWARYFRLVDDDVFAIGVQENMNGESVKLYSDSLSKSTRLVAFKQDSDQVLIGIMKGTPLNNSRIDLSLEDIHGIGYHNSDIRISQKGYYFISLTACATTNNQIKLTLKAPNDTNIHLKRTRETHGHETITRSILLQLKERDHLYLTKSNLEYSSSCEINSFSMFKISDDTPHFFATSYMKHDFNQNKTNTIKFNKIHTLRSIENNLSQNGFRIRSDGFYFIYVSIETKLDSKIDVSIKVNQDIIFEILNANTYSFGHDIVSGSSINHLKYSDIITVVNNGNSDYEVLDGMTSITVFKLS